MVTRSLTALAALLFVLVPGVPAWAHNALAEASPDKEATLAKAPAEVKLRFLQKLNPDYTTITVSNAAKAKVATSAPKVNGATGLVTVDTPLVNGVYTVAYQVVSTDGHTVKGSYQFTVEDPSATAEPAAPQPAPSQSAVAATSAEAGSAPTVPPVLSGASEESSGSTLLGVIAGIVVVLAAAAGYLLIRRRKA